MYLVLTVKLCNTGVAQVVLVLRYEGVIGNSLSLQMCDRARVSRESPVAMVDPRSFGKCQCHMTVTRSTSHNEKEQARI